MYNRLVRRREFEAPSSSACSYIRNSRGNQLRLIFLDFVYSAQDISNFILLLPGNQAISQCLSFADQYLPKLQFRKVVLEFSGLGSSQGKFSFAHYQQDDLHAAIEHLFLKRGCTSLKLVGWNTGAASAILYASQYKFFKIQSILAINPYYNLKTLLKNYLPFIPNFIKNFGFQKTFAVHSQDLDPSRAVSGLQLPCLIVMQEKSQLGKGMQRWRQVCKREKVSVFLKRNVSGESELLKLQIQKVLSL